jgi:class 3 adenylate cyclase
VASPPTGTVTFLFTDIEGSTKLWEEDAPAMQAALARHDELLRWAIEERGGYVFKTVGDAFCCAFPTAPDALKVALEIQHMLLSSEWEETRPLRVRIALHTGAAEERDGDRLFSAYDTTAGGCWIITEADRSSTCVLLPSEY